MTRWRRFFSLQLRHAVLVVGGYALLFGWLLSRPLVDGSYLAESDLYEYYLPIFLAPITTWSSYEFGGLPAFADPGDFSLYPLHFLSRLVGSWALLAVSAYVLAASLTYAYVLHITRSRRAAAFAGISYGLSEAMIERLPHLATLHAFAWLPLIVLAIEGLRTPRRRCWLAAGALGVGCCFLAGHPQPAIYTYYVCATYALIGGWVARAGGSYYRDVFVMFVLGGSVAAIKVIPLAEASAHMARQLVSFGQFVSRANAPAEMLALLLPTVAHDGREAPLYIGIATLALAGIASAHRGCGWRGRFWLIAAAIGLALGAGAATPVARLAYELPLYDKFRVSARHLFLLAFGASVLAGMAIAAMERHEVPARRIRWTIAAVVTLLAAATSLVVSRPALVRLESGADPLWTYLAAAAFSAVAVIAFARTRRAVAFIALCGAAAFDLLHAAPYPLDWAGLRPIVLPRAAAAPSVHAEGLARGLAPTHQRLLSPGGTHRDPVVPGAWARVWRIPIAGGYGPMLLEQHHALAMMGTNGSVDFRVLADDNGALDLLAVKYLAVDAEDLANPERFERNGIFWNRPRLNWSIGTSECGQMHTRRSTIAFPRDLSIRAVAIVGSLRCSEDVPQDQEVGRVRLIGEEGVVHEQPLHAGIEIADARLNDPAVRARAQHHPAARFDDPDLQPHVYAMRLELPRPRRATRLEIEGAPTGGWIAIERVTLIDAADAFVPLAAPAAHLDDARRWRHVGTVRTSRVTDRASDESVSGEQAYHLYENRRAAPRAWLVGRVVGVPENDMIDAVHSSQLPDGTRFDPASMAMVDPGAAEIGTLEPGVTSTRVTEIIDRRITVEVSTEGGGFLVLSEAYYPGWRARIGGRIAAVRRTNVSLQGVAVPPGRHTVVFELVSSSLRAGTAVSLAGLAWVVWVAWRGLDRERV
jgi:hypothetical protein